MPAQQMPRRRKRPTEQELTERLKQYEGLLRKNNIVVEPTEDMGIEDVAAEGGCVSGPSTNQAYFDGSTNVSFGGQPGNVKSEEQALGGVKNFWDAMHQRPPDSYDTTEKANVDNNLGNLTLDDLSEPVIAKVWSRVYESDHNHLFGNSKIDVPLSTLHPTHVQIFRLWQIYSDNINPLLKVTHAPTFQARILDAAMDIVGISREFEALMFSIYCAAIITLSDDSCRATLGDSKPKLLRKYQDACHQALINCEFLRSRERDCLTAFFLYLVGHLDNIFTYALLTTFRSP